ncbi:hypothetical protein [Legionella yabuuchiae]|uniref:hypothetical protein n=1 Tax=Legionella yabuuchiae TaxID=376727 RepID=UPI00105607D9|nr:hypothetical protein [Legionella yabuuchiae]
MATKVFLRPPKNAHQDALQQIQSTSLELNTKNKQKVTLDSKRLNEVFRQSEIDIGRFGFKTPNDLITFLKTPAGESALEHIGEELAQIAALEEYNQFQLQEEQRLKQRIAVAIMVYFAAKNDAHAKELMQYVEEQLEKHLHSEKEILEHEALANNEEPRGETLVDRITNNRTELAQVDNKIKHLEQKIQDIETVHQEYAGTVQAVETEAKSRIFNNKEINQLTPEENTNITQSLSEEIKAVTEQLEKKNNDYIDHVNAYAEDSNPANLKMVNESKKELDKLQLKEEALKDMSDVVEGKKVLLDEHCNQVHSFDKAKFVINKDSADRLVADQGKYYLLKPDQNFSSMSATDKADAQELFHQKKSSFQRLTHMVQERHETLRTDAQRDLNESTTKRTRLETQHQRLHEEIHNNRTNAQAQRGSNMSRPAEPPVPTPTSGPRMR